MSAPLKWGIIGTGGIATTFARDLAFIDDGLVVAVGSRSIDSAESFASAFGIERRYGSYEELVKDSEVDAVYVATPHPMHHDNALLALQHGKPVLVEKAFTMNANEAREIVRAAEFAKLFAMEAMWTRFLPHIIELRKLLAAGVLGDIVFLSADHGKWFDKDSEFRLFAPELGGGALLDLGIYPVSFASMILGTPSGVSARITPAFTGVDGTTSMIFDYESGAQAVLSCTSSARSATRASIVGTEARIEIEGDFYAPTSFSLIPRDGNNVQVFEFVTEGRGLQYQAREVARCIGAGLLESPDLTLNETVSIMETMDKVFVAAGY